MAKEEGIKLEGKVIELLPNAMFRIQIAEQPNTVIGFVSGKIRTNNIKILLGDSVTVEFSAYDLTKCRIIRRN